MTIEEKAKAYDEAIEKARQLCAYPTSKPFISDLQDLFPELKESEDERIRTALIEMVHDTTCDSLWVDYNVHKENALAWLEKQGEQKLTHKDIETILDIENNILHECNDKSLLVIKAYPKGEAYYGEILRRFNNQRIKPQRMISAEAKEAMYNKLASTWSEEDKEMIDEIVVGMEVLKEQERTKYGKELYQQEIDWLKSFKQRNTWKPSDEQLETLKDAINIKPFENPSDNPLWELYEQLKKLKGE